MNPSSPHGRESRSREAPPPGAPQAQALGRHRDEPRPERPNGNAVSDARAVRNPSWRREAATAASHTDANGVEIRKPNTVGQPWVFVEDRSGQPLGMAHPAVARIWRRKGKARMHRIGINVVRLTCEHAQACFRRKMGDVRIGVDPGAKTSGMALVIDDKVVWTAQINHRSASVTLNMSKRRACRNARRCRRKKAAGRGANPARWRYRAKKEGWLPPSVYHQVQSLRRWTRWLARFCEPTADDVQVFIETNAFDSHKVVNPEVEGVGYQQGALWRANLRGYVLTRDKSRCVYCGAGDKSVRFQIDHVIPRTMGGSDRHWNRVAACLRCNKSKDRTALAAWLDEKAPAKARRRKSIIWRYVEDVAKGRIKLSAMAAATVVGPCLVKKLRAEGFAVETSSGADTAAWRRMAGVEKSHTNDAACTATRGRRAAFRCERHLNIDMTGRGRRLVVKRDKHGMPRRRNDGNRVAAHRETPAHGFRAGDTVRIEKNNFGRRRRVAVLKSARHDGRLNALLGNGKRVNLMAAKATLIHRTPGAIVR